MAYATTDDIEKRYNADLSEKALERCAALLDDAAVIIDAYNSKASDDAKKLVSCNMVIRAMGDADTAYTPIGSTQGSISALGYSQSWANANGSGELYLTRIDKKLLGSGNSMGFVCPYSDEEMEA